MDIVLVGFMAGLAFGGFRTGLILRLFGLLFIAISFVLGAYLRGPFGAIATSIFKDIPPDYASLVGYTFAFPVILAVLHLVTYPVTRRFHPQGLTKQVDRGLGAVFGFIEAVLILSVVVVIFDAYFVKGLETGNLPGLDYFTSLAAAFNQSETVHILRQTTVPLVLTVLGPLLPKDISSLIPTGVPGLPGLPGGIPGVPLPTKR
jgi:colicin V production protein